MKEGWRGMDGLEAGSFCHLKRDGRDSQSGWKPYSGIVSTTWNLDWGIVYMSLTNSQHSQMRSKKFISWALAILSDECNSCAVRADCRVCSYLLALSICDFLIWKKWLFARSPTHASSYVRARLLVNCIRRDSTQLWAVRLFWFKFFVSSKEDDLKSTWGSADTSTHYNMDVLLLTLWSVTVYRQFGCHLHKTLTFLLITISV